MDSDNDRDRNNKEVEDSQEIPPAAVVTSSMTQGNMDSGNVGMLGASLIGGLAANDLTDAAREDGEDARDEELGKMDLDGLERFGSAYRETGDEGVSQTQRDLEADELNG
ncbi:MAG: hypothetical protein ABI670_06585 [Chloroflexota bacterium]